MENIIYLVGVQGASKNEMEKIRDEANKIFKDLGLETRVEIFKDSADKFDENKIDDTDGVAVFGYKSEVVKFAKEKLKSITSDEFRNTDLSERFEKGQSTPEYSQNGGRMIALDAGQSLTEWSNRVSESREKAAGFNIVHGAGHSAGMGHPFGGIMTDGLSIANRIQINNLKYEDAKKIFNEGLINIVKTYQAYYKSIQDFICPPDGTLNESYNRKMKEKFGGNPAKAN